MGKWSNRQPRAMNPGGAAENEPPVFRKPGSSGDPVPPPTESEPQRVALIDDVSFAPLLFEGSGNTYQGGPLFPERARTVPNAGPFCFLKPSPWEAVRATSCRGQAR